MKLLIILLFLLYFVQDAKVTRLNLSTTLFVYGIRWFFAESFSYPEHLNKKVDYDDLVLMFNTYEVNPDLTFHLQIYKEAYQCTTKRVSISIKENLHNQFNSQASPIGTVFTTYIHKCPLRFEQPTFLQQNKKIDYSITLKDDTVTNIVYSGSLRSPLFSEQDIKAITLGDWGKITKGSPYYDFLDPIDNCLSQKIYQEDPNFMIILGDVGYDMEGDTYIDFLLYLQPYSSRLVILFTPGNHQTSKHPDIYPLVMQSFYSPYWSQFYGYFDMAMIGNYVFVGYNPDSLFRKSLFSILFGNSYKTHFQLFSDQFTPSIKEKLANEYTVISISHYPIFCSQDDQHNNCSFHLQSQQKYLNLLQQLKTDLFMGAHLHYYERSKPICDSEGLIFKSPTKETSERDIYLGKTCPIHLVEGSAGNNYFVQTTNQFPLKKFAKRYVTNTGFGVITLFTPNSDLTINYRHFSTVNKCSKADDFSIESNFSSNSFLMFLFNSTGSYVVLLIIITVILHQIYCYLNKRKQLEDKEHRAQTTMELQIDTSYG